MANPNVKFGLRPVRSLNGAPYNGQVNVYATASGDGVALGLGDPVKIAGTGQIVNGQSYTDVARAATGDVMVGSVVSVLPETRDSTVYRAASTIRLVEVADDPNTIFEIQESAGTALTISAAGLNANFVVTASVDTATALSGVELDVSTPPATTNTFDLKIIGLVNRPDNLIGTNAKWLVRINRHLYANQVAGT